MANRKDGSSSRSHFRIDDLHVQPERNLIVRKGQQIQLERRMMQVLAYLAEHAGETVGTGTLLVELWGSEVYGDNPVNKTVSLLRKLIGDHARNPRYIETIQKVGYRMIATVSMPEDYRRLPTELWTDGSPYVGLSAFDARHAPVYCGRSRIVADLLRAMRNQIENQRRFVMIVGASGCGKTSLLRAGAIPLLTKPDGYEGLRTLSIAACDLAAAPAHDPLTPLIEAIARWTLDEGGTDGDRPVFPPQTTEQLQSLLTGHPDNIEHFVTEAFRRHPEKGLAEQPHAHLLLTIDHAETLVASADIDMKIRETFENLLLALCDCPHVLVTMIARSDFYPKITETLPALTERKAGDGHLDVLPPRYGEIGEIIRTPAWRANLSFEIDPDSRDRLDDVLRDAAVAQPDALPLLQHTLETLYEHRSKNGTLTFSAYNDIGGLEGAIAHRAEQIFATLPTHGQESLNTVLARLIIIQTDSDAVSAHLFESSIFDTDARVLVDAFINARLFVSGLHNGRPTVGVVHESLLRRWPRAVEWIQNNRRVLQARTRLKRATERWLEQGRSPDHLLNAGMPLIEAIEAGASTRDLDENEIALLSASQQLSTRRKTAKIAAIVTLTTLAVVSTLASLLAISALEDAERRRTDAERLADYMLGPLADELRPLGKLKLLSGIGRESLDYLSRRNQSDLNPGELAMLARGSRTVGESLKDMGKTEESRKLFEQAVKLSDAAMARDPKLSRAIFERGNAAYWLGLIHFESKNYTLAETHWSEYLRYSKKLTSASPNNVAWIREESYGYHSLGALAERRGDTRRSLELLRASEKMKMRALAIDENNIDIRNELILTQSWISTTLESMNRIEEASAGYDRQIESLQSLISIKPESNTWKHQLANYLQLGSNVDIARGNVAKAEIALIRSTGLLTTIVTSEPEHTEWEHDKIRSRIMLADTQFRAGKIDNARTQLRLADAELSKSESSSENAANWRSLRARWLLSDAMTRPMEERLKKQGEAIAIFDTLPTTGTNHDLAFAYATALIARGRTRAVLGYRNDARNDWENALKILDSHPEKANRYDRLHARIDALQLLDRTTQIQAPLEALLAAGYRHPDFETIFSPEDMDKAPIIRDDSLPSGPCCMVAKKSI